MRVISGSARGRRLKGPENNKIKPTTDRVKEAIFSIIQFDIEDRRVLDLFAGTGQLGIEALSRGAGSAVFVDSSSDSVRLINENLLICGFTDLATVHGSNAFRYHNYDGRFDIIFIDPPYDEMTANKVLMNIIEFDKLSVNGIIIYEMKTAVPIPEITPPYVLQKIYKYGQTTLLKITRSELI